MRLPKLSSNRLPTLQGNQPTLQRQESYGQGRGGRPWRRLKQAVHVRDLWTCCQCGRVTMDLECDHIINKAQGGTDDMHNLQSLCKDCHSKKTIQESKQGQGVMR
ncbi:HNH endonuclease [Acinetobacter sp. ME22]|uniref:HNH endonuclease n=1 Tax=Acinetobacter sp. ME22 TaxID=2904802 RepID=UPI001EDC46D5|nr:HNH endonuclease [Acinetobacter sp. ME22]MCG2574213.1 HNH endonuclease [Acinetobacter sp. ME22]